MTNKKFCLDVYRIAFCFNEIVQTAVFIENEVTNESMIFKIILQSTTFILSQGFKIWSYKIPQKKYLLYGKKHPIILPKWHVINRVAVMCIHHEKESIIMIRQKKWDLLDSKLSIHKMYVNWAGAVSEENQYQFTMVSLVDLRKLHLC